MGTFFRKWTFFGTFFCTLKSVRTFIRTIISTLFSTFLVAPFLGNFFGTFLCTLNRRLLFLALFIWRLEPYSVFESQLIIDFSFYLRRVRSKWQWMASQMTQWSCLLSRWLQFFAEKGILQKIETEQVHILHLVWSASAISTAIKTPLKVALSALLNSQNWTILTGQNK